MAIADASASEVVALSIRCPPPKLSVEAIFYSMLLTLSATAQSIHVTNVNGAILYRSISGRLGLRQFLPSNQCRISEA